MRIIINGFPEEVGPEESLPALIVRFNEQDPTLIVELNGAYVHRKELDAVRLKEGDRVEFIHAAFGG